LIAQINVTAISLDFMSQTHWIVKGFIMWSLTTSLMAVYYATRQQRNIGRLIDDKEIREWIRGGPEKITLVRNMKLASWIRTIDTKRQALGDGFAPREREMSQITAKYDWDQQHGRIVVNPGVSILETREPDKMHPEVFYMTDGWRLPKRFLIRNVFSPSVAAVITISAPQMLLSASLFSLLIAMGMYFGLNWTMNFDTTAGSTKSRNIFIFYVVGLAVGMAVYSFSSFLQNDNLHTEYEIVESYCDGWLINPDNDIYIRRWGFKVYIARDGKIALTKLRDGVDHPTRVHPDHIQSTAGDGT
jgi:hypothetical protein